MRGDKGDISIPGDLLGVLDPAEVLLWAVLARLSDRIGWCSPSQTALARLFRVSRRQIRRYLADLEKKGYIRVQRCLSLFGRRNMYIPVIPMARYDLREEDIDEFIRLYPEPDGGMPSRHTIRRAILERFYAGVSPDVILGGVRRYRRYIELQRRITGRAFVRDPRNWLREQEYERSYRLTDEMRDALMAYLPESAWKGGLKPDADDADWDAAAERYLASGY